MARFREKISVTNTGMRLHAGEELLEQISDQALEVLLVIASYQNFKPKRGAFTDYKASFCLVSSQDIDEDAFTAGTAELLQKGQLKRYANGLFGLASPAANAVELIVNGKQKTK